MRISPIAGGLEVLAPAKLNLFLEVLGKRDDGYHELETLMVATDLHDTLRFEDDPSGQVSLTCDDAALPLGGENLVVRAAGVLRARSGSGRGARIDLRKAIPTQAGLAGGSSDAAATLLGLDQLWGLKTPPDDMEAMAAEIGSDVAFFLNGPAAICRGRGERVEPVDLPCPLHFVLICPPWGLGTADVYRRLTPPPEHRPIGPILEALRTEDFAALGRNLFNRLQPAAESIEPRLAAILGALEAPESHLDGHLMSGSGSACFGLCRDEGAAGHAARHLERLGLGRVRVVACGP